MRTENLSMSLGRMLNALALDLIDYGLAAVARACAEAVGAGAHVARP